MNPVVVIGAGPYGLSTAAHLKARGVPIRIFGTPMSSWTETMPQKMVLKSTPDASTISAPGRGHTLQDFCDAVGEPRLVTERDLVTLEFFVRYGEWFTERLVPEVERVRVASVDRDAREFRVKLESGEELTAPAVVVASGLSGFAHVPEALLGAAPGGPSATGPVSHSSQHTDLDRFAGRDVLVVGAGQSALESAALLAEGGASVTVLARRRGSVGFGAPPREGIQWKPDSPVGRAWSLYAFSNVPGPSAFRYLPEPTRLWLVRKVLGPRGAWWLHDRFEGRAPVVQGREPVATRLDPATNRVILTTRGGAEGNSRDFSADHVLAATGYRVDVDALDFLGPGLRARLTRTGGSPLLDRGYVGSVPGLYFTGLPSAATFGPLMRFVCGTRYASPRLAAAVTARVRGAGAAGAG
ncbi:NAD(P)/FAD-dependent oxidoreductase [Streptomyces sp. ICBB 8177]|uniref:FAD-dependent oxidoreductase n=1 Tax=Streptomyces sp. ICBB 8177 TaxID=563922 RepID=UPI000D678F4B|nr:NAD(P)/FAD-dependent oxidoreductase [Streptomyces sp. ICBB 8177]PWI45643.1 oxidoreductase [Streptomyces sp. ICBB 8177]